MAALLEPCRAVLWFNFKRSRQPAEDQAVWAVLRGGGEGGRTGDDAFRMVLSLKPPTLSALRACGHVPILSYRL